MPYSDKWACAKQMDAREIAANIAKQSYFLACSKSLPVLGLMR